MSSKHRRSQTVKARGMKLLEKVHLPPPVTYHMSHVSCHMSLNCFLTFIFFSFFCLIFSSSFNFFLLWTKWWSYSVEGLLSTGLPRLVYTQIIFNNKNLDQPKSIFEYLATCPAFRKFSQIWAGNITVKSKNFTKMFSFSLFQYVVHYVLLTAMSNINGYL